MEKINDHLGLIIKITAEQYRKHPTLKDNYSLDELINENYIKACSIIDSFDESRGVKVSTFLSKTLIYHTTLSHLRNKEVFRRKVVNGKDTFTLIGKDSMNEVISDDGKQMERGSTIPSNYNLENDVMDKIVIGQALSKLNNIRRQVIEEYFYNGLGQQEIAKKMNLAQASVSRNLKAALKELKEDMSNEN